MRCQSTPIGRVLLPVLGLAALTLLPPGAARAQTGDGPWVQTKDGYYATSRLFWGSTHSYFDSNGDVVTPSPEETFKVRPVTLDAEYGISNRLSLRLGMPVLFQSFDSPANSFHATNNGFSDLLFGFKYGFLDPAGRPAVALEVLANTPTGYNSNGLGVPPLGFGKFSAEGHLRAGLTLDPAPAYVQAEVGYRKFTDKNVSNAITYGAEAGYFATPRVLLLANLDAEKARDDTKFFFESYTQAQGLVQYGVKPHVDVMAGYTRVLSGKNVNRLGAVVLGVALKGNWIGRYRGQATAGELAPPRAAATPATAPAPALTPPPAATPAPATIPPPSPAPSDTTQAPGQPK